MSTAPGRLTAALSDRYRLERELGQGGMATVFLAEDLKHNRKVAIKVLKPELAAVLGAERFVTEIKTTAALQHPNILPLFDSGEADGFLYYVMPYVEGETLRAKLNRETQLSIEEAVRITTEVADALDYAHRHGVIHRDIKPENVLLHDGRPMVADFGIALAVSAAAGGRITETGLSLGTPRYMSPEQATAEKNITNRSDIYSLGAVLYELLAGQPPHTGASAQQIIARIVTEAPRPVTALRKAVPPHIAAALAKALEKLPADRFESAKAFAEALANPTFRHGAAATEITARGMRGRGHDPVFLAVAAAGVLAIVVATWGWLRPHSLAPRVTWESSIVLPDSAPLGLGFDISRDGSVLVYSSGGPDQLLGVRRAGAPRVVPLSGTAVGMFPRISPDGRRVAFLRPTDGTIEVVSLNGGAPIRVAYSGWNSPLVWTDDDHLAFQARGVAIVQADVGGGSQTTLVRSDTAIGGLIFTPRDALPGHRGLIVAASPSSLVSPDSIRIGVVGPSGGAPTILTPGVWARYAAPSQLIVTRADGSVVAFPFDPESRRITGRPKPLWTGVRPGLLSSGGMVAVSADGRGVYAPGGGGVGGVSELVHVTRGGAVTRIDSRWAYPFLSVAVSPDGHRLAAGVAAASLVGGVDASGSGEAILIRDLATGSVARVSTPDGLARDPVFTPDGRSVIFVESPPPVLERVSVRGGTPEEIWPASGTAHSGSEHRAPDTSTARLSLGDGTAIARDGRHVYFVVNSAGQQERTSELRVVSLDSLGTPSRVVLSSVGAAVPSPDGRWLAYLSIAGTTWQVNVRSTNPSRDEEWHVAPSADHWSVLRWSRDGREIYYLAGDSLYAAAVRGDSTLTIGSPHALFATTPYGGRFDVTPDGAFVMIRQVFGGRGATELRMIDDLRALAGQ